MNDLILYMYLTDVHSSLSSFLFLSVMVLFAVLTMTSVEVIARADKYGFDAVKPFLRRVYIPMFVVFCVLGLIKIALPSLQTVYTALRLHIDNQVMQQPEIAQEDSHVLRILQAKLDEYEEELTQESKK